MPLKHQQSWVPDSLSAIFPKIKEINSSSDRDVSEDQYFVDIDFKMRQVSFDISQNEFDRILINYLIEKNNNYETIMKVNKTII